MRFGINVTFTENFLVGPVPVVVQYSMGLNGTAGGGVATITPAVLDFSQYRWDYTSTGFTLEIAFTPALSAGVGIAGFATVSLKGAFSLTFYLTIGPLPEGYEDKPEPRLRLALKAVLSVEIETFLFTKSVELAAYEAPQLYDNWSSGKVQDIDPYRCLTDGLSLAEVFEDAQIITESSLADLAEFSAVGFGDSGPQVKKMPLATRRNPPTSTCQVFPRLRWQVLERWKTSIYVWCLVEQTHALQDSPLAQCLQKWLVIRRSHAFDATG